MRRKKQQSWNGESEGKLMWEGRKGIGKPEKYGQLLLLCSPSCPSRNLPSFRTNERECPGFQTLCCRQSRQQGHGLFTSPFACSFPKLPHNLLPLAFLWQHPPSLVTHLTGPDSALAVQHRSCSYSKPSSSHLETFIQWMIYKHGRLDRKNRWLALHTPGSGCDEH